MNFDLPELTPETPAGVLCQVKIGDLKPTQNAVGFDEVNDNYGGGPIRPKDPCAHIKDLANDPYRSLAWDAVAEQAEKLLERLEKQWQSSINNEV